MQILRAISTNTINLIARDAGADAKELPVEIDDYAFGSESQERSRDSAHHAGAKLRVPGRAGTKRLPSGERGDDCQMSHLSHRGDNNFTTTLKPGATLVKEWNGPSAIRLYEKRASNQRTNLFSSGHEYLADPSDVEAKANVTTPLNGSRFRTKSTCRAERTLSSTRPRCP